MLRIWHTETRQDGPHHNDVVVFEKYLSKLILEERDMEKAKSLVKWLEWTVEEELTSNRKMVARAKAKGTLSWRNAMKRIKEQVQSAVSARGLGPMSY